MLSSKQRAVLRGMAGKLQAVQHIGKSGLTPEVTASVDEVLERRELVKITVLGNCESAPEQIAEVLSGRTHSDVVQVIGKKIVLFRRNKTKPVIEFPK